MKFKLHPKAVTKSRNEHIVVKSLYFVTKNLNINLHCDSRYKQKPLGSSVSFGSGMEEKVLHPYSIVRIKKAKPFVCIVSVFQAYLMLHYKGRANNGLLLLR